MPIYEYACEKCERQFEKEQRITDDPIKSCPHCKSRRIKRLISRTSFVLKGSGWYSDLYSSRGAKEDKAAKPDSGEDKTASNAEDSKTKPKGESKSADDSSTKEKPAAKNKSGDKGSKAARR